MTARQLQIKAYSEWSDSTDLKCQFHTFDYYWAERYARIYRLPTRVKSVGRLIH